MNDETLGGHANRESVIEALNRLCILHQGQHGAFLDAFGPDALFADTNSPGILTGTAIAEWIETTFETKTHIKWVWQTIELDTHADMGWFIADGQAITSAARTGEQESTPFRLSGVLKCENGAWVWQLFHGSTPNIGED